MPGAGHVPVPARAVPLAPAMAVAPPSLRIRPGLSGPSSEAGAAPTAGNMAHKARPCGRSFSPIRRHTAPPFRPTYRRRRVPPSGTRRPWTPLLNCREQRRVVGCSSCLRARIFHKRCPVAADWVLFLGELRDDSTGHRVEPGLVMAEPRAAPGRGTRGVETARRRSLGSCCAPLCFSCRYAASGRVAEAAGRALSMSTPRSRCELANISPKSVPFPERSHWRSFRASLDSYTTPCTPRGSAAPGPFDDRPSMRLLVQRDVRRFAARPRLAAQGLIGTASPERERDERLLEPPLELAERS